MTGAGFAKGFAKVFAKVSAKVFAKNFDLTEKTKNFVKSTLILLTKYAI